MTTRDFAATTFVVDADRTLLLWHRQIEAWLPPGGHVELHELPDVAAVREVREETGLEVELLGAAAPLGRVQVLPQPVCLLLEDIRPGHQHIDLIYFARVRGGTLRLDPAESTAHRWCTAAGLEHPDIATDIRVLGQRAIAALSAR